MDVSSMRMRSGLKQITAGPTLQVSYLFVIPEIFITSSQEPPVPQPFAAAFTVTDICTLPSPLSEKISDTERSSASLE